MRNFALVGAAGYVAPRHFRAIKDTGNKLLAALDKTDSVGIIDQFFPEADFFVEFERFDRHLDKIKRKGEAIHFVSICSPNYLHDSHIRFGLKQGADVICEKPLVLNPRNIEPLENFQRENGRKIYNILQLRLHPSIISLKKTDRGTAINSARCRSYIYYLSWKLVLYVLERRYLKIRWNCH